MDFSRTNMPHTTAVQTRHAKPDARAPSIVRPEVALRRSSPPKFSLHACAKRFCLPATVCTRPSEYSALASKELRTRMHQVYDGRN